MSDVNAPAEGNEAAPPAPPPSPATPPPQPRDAEPEPAPAPTPEPTPEPTPAPTPAPPGPPPSAPEAPRKHHVAPALISLDRVDDDGRFRLRLEDGDVSALATDLARLGQLFPVELRLKPPDRFQVITGFRRVAALRFLKREKVLARLHTDLTDADGLLLALAEAIHSHPVRRTQLLAFQERLDAEGRLEGAAKEMLEKALAEDDGLAPEEFEGEEEEEEVDADELAGDVAVRLGAINQDLSLLADVFADLDPARRDELLKQLKYSADLVEYLDGLK